MNPLDAATAAPAAPAASACAAFGSEPPERFAAPWHAQLFALLNVLLARQVVLPGEWSATFSAILRREEAAGFTQAEKYYECMAEAIEQALLARRLLQDGEVDRLTQEWLHVASTTPHGQPLELKAPGLSPR